jgi:hypothetical protein
MGVDLRKLAKAYDVGYLGVNTSQEKHHAE